MPKRIGFSSFLDWKHALLARHQLDKPDGRDLYRYRLTESDFVDLEKLLADWLQKLSRFDLSQISRLTGFAGLFVLYAAEWWRRRFDGSHWSWDPILRNIGAEPDEWRQFQRSECVRLGLQDWGLKPRSNGGLRFLGSVAVQGGLPLKLLAEARGGIGRLLGTVFNVAGDSAVTPADLLTWVTSQQITLPKSYRQEAIFALLADVAWTVLRLKDEARLSSSADALERLDRQVPGWRERFPLPVEDGYAQGLIDQIVRDAASVRPQRQAVCLPLGRCIKAGEEGNWTLCSSVTLPDTVSIAALVNLFGVTKNELPRAGELALSAGTQRFSTSVRRLAGHEDYRIDRQPWEYSDEVAAFEHQLHLSAPDARVWSAVVPRGESLDDELPWVFSAERGSCAFLRQGSGTVAAAEVLVALPAGWVARPQDGAEVVACGRLGLPERKVVRVRGSALVQDGTGLICRIRTGQADSTNGSYEWRGERCWLDFQIPTMAFRGMPSLYRMGQDGSVRKMEGNPAWSPIGSQPFANAKPIGPVSLCYPATGEVKQRTRLVVLPKNASLRVESGDATSGTIKLVDWGATSARVVTDGVRHQSHCIDSVLSLALSVPPTAHVPERVEIEVLWQQSPTPVRLALPFPAKGARAFNADGKELPSNSALAAQQLAGVRLLILGANQNPQMILEFSGNGGLSGRKHKLCAQPGTISAEVRLQDFAQDIQHLLSANDSPDAQVVAELRIGGASAVKLRIARYAARLEKSGSEILLDESAVKALPPAMLEALPVMALRLERPADEPVQLPACASGGIACGSWQFLPDAREPGSWLIYPGRDASPPFRPTLWRIAGDVPAGSLLASAISLPDESARKAALDSAIAAMVGDFGESSWTEIELLANQLGHLPLATLDVWRRFARSSRGMAAMALRFATFPSGFLERFALELPFLWEAVPFAAWRQAVACLRAQCMANFGNDAGAYVFHSHLDARIKDMAAMNGALHFLLGLASTEYILEAARHRQVLREFGHMAFGRLFEGDNSLVMCLRRMHAEDDWPTGLGKMIAENRNRSHVASFLCPSQHGFADGMINMPLLLAAQAATDQTESWFASPAAIHHLRRYRAFDPEWFDEAYNLTIAHCLARGLLGG